MDKHSPDTFDNVLSADLPLHRASRKKDKTAAKRSKAYRQRKKQESTTAASAELSSEEFLPRNSRPTARGTKKRSVTSPANTPHDRSENALFLNTVVRADLLAVTPSRHFLTSLLLVTAALALSAVGIAINGWFALSLGSSDMAAWLFLAIGVASDLATLVLPYTAARLWHTGRRPATVVGWVVWFVTFTFAVTAGIGFVSSNITGVTLVRASRVTPAVMSAQAMLADAITASDRECKGGVGRFCREREALVAERRQILDAAMTSVAQTADPQTEAAIKVVAWISGGAMRPTSEDFSMFRLILFALLPHLGGLLLLVGRQAPDTGSNLTRVDALACPATEI